MTEPSEDREASDTPAEETREEPHGTAETEQFPVPPPAARRSDPPPQYRRSAPQPWRDVPHDGQDGQGQDVRHHEDQDTRDRTASVLDRPVDDVDLATRLRRPGLARSTRILLLVLGAVVCVVVGLFVGRATAPDTGPGSVPDILGVVESVQPTGGGFPIVTVRAGDGSQTALRTTAGTDVAVPRPDGPAGLRVGQQVTVHAERGADGAITAVRVDVPAGS